MTTLATPIIKLPPDNTYYRGIDWIEWEPVLGAKWYHVSFQDICRRYPAKFIWKIRATRVKAPKYENGLRIMRVCAHSAGDKHRAYSEPIQITLKLLNA